MKREKKFPKNKSSNLRKKKHFQKMDLKKNIKHAN